MKKCKKLLALLLVVLMMVSLLPTTALAATGDIKKVELKSQLFILYVAVDDGSASLKFTELKNAGSLSSWQKTFYCEDFENGRYYKIYAMNGDTKYYLSGYDSVSITSNSNSAGQYDLCNFQNIDGIYPWNANSTLVVTKTQTGPYRIVFSGVYSAQFQIKPVKLTHTVTYDLSKLTSYKEETMAASAPEGLTRVGNSKSWTAEVDKNATATSWDPRKANNSQDTTYWLYKDRNGWHFFDWNTPITGAITLYARDHITLTFDGNGGTIPFTDLVGTTDRESVIYYLTPGMGYLDNPFYSTFAPNSRAGYKFIGWYTSATEFNSATEFRITTKLYDDFTVYAGWERTGPAYTAHVITSEPSETEGNDYTRSYGETDIKVRYEDEKGNLITFANPVSSFPITPDSSGKVTVDFDNFVVPAGSDTDKYNGGPNSSYKFVKAFFYFDGHGASLSGYTGRIVDVDSFSLLKDKSRYNSWFSYHVSAVHGGTIQGTTFDYNPTGVLHLVFTTPVNVNFDLNYTGATGAPAAQSVYKYEYATKPTDPTRNGYTFNGWYTSATVQTADTKWDFEKDEVTAEMTLYAGWTQNAPQTVTVTYDTNGGTLTVGEVSYPTTAGDLYMETVTVGGTATAPADPTLDGCIFSGWYTLSNNGYSAFDFTTEIKEDLTLYALYNLNVTFHPQGGTLTVGEKGYTDVDPYVVRIARGGTVSDPGTPVRDGYTFTGWYTKTDSGLSTTPFDFTTPLNTGLDLYAGWQELHTVTFDPNGGTMTVGETSYPVEGTGALYSDEVVDGGNYTIPDVNVIPAEGYRFLGWARKDGEGTLGEVVTELQNVTEDVTLYAKYEPILLTVTYDSAGGELVVGENTYTTADPYSEKVQYGGTSDMSAVPTRIGYTFDGWFCLSQSDSQTEPTETTFTPGTTKVYTDLNVYAKWTEKTATLSYTAYTVSPAGADGGSVSPASETIGVLTGVPTGSQATASLYYQFVGWYVGDTKVSDSAVLTKSVIDAYAKDDNGLYQGTTFTAHFTERVYTVDIAKTVTRSSSSEKPGEVSFTFELGARHNGTEDTTVICSTGITTNGTGEYTGSITVYGHMLANLDAQCILTEKDDGRRYWRYDENVYQLTFDPDGDTVGIALEGKNGSTTVVSAAAFENRYSRAESKDDSGRIKVIKIDEDDRKTCLQGAKFKLYETGTNRLVSTLKTDKDGEDTISVAEGNYYLVESTSPEGYARDTDPIRVTVKADKTTTVYITNKRTGTPESLNNIDHYAYIIGYPGGTVRPQGSITRAEVATIFFRLLTDDVRNGYLTDNNSYSDVNPGDWYCTAVSTLSKMGIINGYTDGTFDPNGYITRAEFAAIAARFERNGNTTEADFSDIYTHWAKKEISIAANNGWILGYEDGSFRPNQLITRAEAMTLVNRVLNRVPEDESDLLRGMIQWKDNRNTDAWYYLAVQEATNSHEFERKDNGYETWTRLRANRDWTEFER